MQLFLVKFEKLISKYLPRFSYSAFLDFEKQVQGLTGKSDIHDQKLCRQQWNYNSSQFFVGCKSQSLRNRSLPTWLQTPCQNCLKTRLKEPKWLKWLTLEEDYAVKYDFYHCAHESLSPQSLLPLKYLTRSHPKLLAALLNRAMSRGLQFYIATG